MASKSTRRPQQTGGATTAPKVPTPTAETTAVPADIQHATNVTAPDTVIENATNDSGDLASTDLPVADADIATTSTDADTAASDHEAQDANADTDAPTDAPDAPEAAYRASSGLAAPGGTAPEGRILEEGDEITIQGRVENNLVHIEEDVFRKVYPYRSKRPTFVLLYAKGTSVPLTALQAVGTVEEN